MFYVTYKLPYITIRVWGTRWHGWGYAQRVGSSRVRFPMVSSFRPYYGPEVDSTSNSNEYQKYFLGDKGGRCVGLTNLLEIWEPQPPGTLRACNVIAIPWKYVVHFSHSLPSEKKSVNTTFVDHRLSRLSDIHDILYLSCRSSAGWMKIGSVMVVHFWRAYKNFNLYVPDLLTDFGEIRYRRPSSSNAGVEAWVSW
jgi:hypothetical protein